MNSTVYHYDVIFCQCTPWTLATALGNNDATLAQEKLQLTPPLPIPIFLPINRYADHLRQFAPIERRQRTLAAFISQYLIERQSSLELPADFFRQLLAQGTHVILLLDGLDEVSSEAEREQVVQAVQDLVRGHEQLRVVVTCRTAAYRGIDQFREVRVQLLTEEHISHLVTNAYRYVYAGSPERQLAQTADLLTGIRQLEAERQQRLGERAERLISSPLLVRMMLIVHISERKLPDQRAELYLRATENLLEPTYARDVNVQQDIGRMIGGERALEMVQYIAYQMHGRGQQQGREITERELETLLRNHPTCADLTDTFLSLTRQRGTVMETIGETYRFIHLGFQELLAARYMDEVLLRQHSLPDVLGDKLQDSWWREPLLLLPGYCVAVKGPSRAEAVINYLAGLDGGELSTGFRNLRWHAASLAATALYEWRDAPPHLRQALLDRLLALLAEDVELAQKSSWQRWWGQLTTLPLLPATRLGLGIALGQLGDPRPGVGVLRDGVPDIAWGSPVPVGTYTIGGIGEYNGQIRQVPIKEAYQLAKYPITNTQFAAFVNAPDVYKADWWAGLLGCTKKFDDSTWLYGNHPRTDVIWCQAVAFCRWLSDKLGYEVRLPHEHEWEVAARYGHGKVYPWGSDVFDQTKLNVDKTVGQTTAVGLYPTGRQPELDLYDMSGNVWEWCQNKYEEPEVMAVNESLARRVLRGGSWNDPQDDARVAYRVNVRPSYRGTNVGLRVVRVLRRPLSHPGPLPPVRT